MTEITLGVLKDFVMKHGDIKIVDLNGKTKILESGKPDAFDLAEKANRFCFEGRWYSREGFEKLLDEID